MLFSLLYFLVHRILGAGGCRQAEQEIKLLVLRHQLKVLQPAGQAASTPRIDRVLLAAASRGNLRDQIKPAVALVQEATACLRPATAARSRDTILPSCRAALFRAQPAEA